MSAELYTHSSSTACSGPYLTMTSEESRSFSSCRMICSRADDQGATYGCRAVCRQNMQNSQLPIGRSPATRQCQNYVPLCATSASDEMLALEERKRWQSGEPRNGAKKQKLTTDQQQRETAASVANAFDGLSGSKGTQGMEWRGESPGRDANTLEGRSKMCVSSCSTREHSALSAACYRNSQTQGSNT